MFFNVDFFILNRTNNNQSSKMIPIDREIEHHKSHFNQNLTYLTDYFADFPAKRYKTAILIATPFSTC